MIIKIKPKKIFLFKTVSCWNCFKLNKLLFSAIMTETLKISLNKLSCMSDKEVKMFKEEVEDNIYLS